MFKGAKASGMFFTFAKLTTPMLQLQNSFA
jgi:hypothetical protein